MSMSDSGQYGLLDQLAEEFAARFRRSERPVLTGYTFGGSYGRQDHARFTSFLRIKAAPQSNNLRAARVKGGDQGARDELYS
jgi:hypothetical protein